MLTFGQINEFRPENESFSVYLERFELFVLANSIPDSKKVLFFLTVLGGNTYGVLHNLMAPDNQKDKSFETITGVLKVHFEPKPLIIAQMFHFHRRDQAQGEPVAEYLRRLASKCNFRAYLDENTQRQAGLWSVERSYPETLTHHEKFHSKTRH